MRMMMREEDPDTLFFNRKLQIEGDTELGLITKNLLDSVDWPFGDWFLKRQLSDWTQGSHIWIWSAKIFQAGSPVHISEIRNQMKILMNRFDSIFWKGGFQANLDMSWYTIYSSAEQHTYITVVLSSTKWGTY